MPIKNVKCENCSEAMTARTADIKRGWGRYCSKSCKAIAQTKRQNHNYYNAHNSGGTLFDSDGNHV